MMNSKSLLVLFAACAVSFSAAAQSSPSTLSLRGGPALDGDAKNLAISDEAAEAALRRALLLDGCEYQPLRELTILGRAKRQSRADN